MIGAAACTNAADDACVKLVGKRARAARTSRSHDGRRCWCRSEAQTVNRARGAIDSPLPSRSKCTADVLPHSVPPCAPFHKLLSDPAVMQQVLLNTNV